MLGKDFFGISLDDLNQVVDHCTSQFSGRDVILLFGDVGAGKTTFSKTLLGRLGSRDAVSPTFALHNEYKVGELSVDHLDLYRLESLEEIDSIGFWDLFFKQSGLILVEWAENLRGEPLPKAWTQHHLKITRQSDSELRDFSYLKIKQLQSSES